MLLLIRDGYWQVALWGKQNYLFFCRSLCDLGFVIQRGLIIDQLCSLTSLNRDMTLKRHLEHQKQRITVQKGVHTTEIEGNSSITQIFALQHVQTTLVLSHPLYSPRTNFWWKLIAMTRKLRRSSGIVWISTPKR